MIANKKLKIAVVGSGIAGLGSAWILADHHEVHLFEADDRLGGHSNTIDVTIAGKTFPVDTGFLVHNDRTYPHLIELFKMLEIKTCPSNMSLSVRVEDKNLEWGGSDLISLFGQKKNFLRMGFYRMIKDILRINKHSLKYLERSIANKWSLGEFLEKEKFSQEFRNWYLIPMGASIWSSPTKQMLDFPASSFIQFSLNHGLLQIFDRPQWKTIIGGSRKYVEKMAEKIKNISLSTPVTSVFRKGNICILEAAGETYEFDKVIFATHPPQTLQILKDATDAEKNILSQFSYQPNTAVVHTDISLLPKRRKIWSSWHFHSQKDELDSQAISVTYLINKLQPLPVPVPVMVTLNPAIKIDEKKVLRTISYSHPLFCESAKLAQSQLPQIQGQQACYFAGAWSKHGFHEDGIASAVDVCERLGVLAPWIEHRARFSLVKSPNVSSDASGSAVA